MKILIFLLKIKFPPYMPIIFVMQGKCLFSDISRPVIHAPSSTFLLCVREQLCTWQDCADVKARLSIRWSHVRLMHATHELARFIDSPM